MKDKSFQSLLVVVVIGVLLNWALNHMGTIGDTIKYIVKILLPFIFGASLAFVLNIFVDKVEKFLSERFKIKKNLSRILGLVITILGVTIFIVLLMIIVIPELLRTFDFLIQQIPDVLTMLQGRIDELVGSNDNWAELIETFDLNFQNIFERIQSASEAILKSISGAMVSIFTSIIDIVVTLFIGITFSIYVVLAKDSLSRQSKEILYALLPKKHADQAIRIGNLSYNSFSGFLTGQGIEALILGGIFFVAMTIFKMPYAMLISVVIMVFSIVPIFGAFIGAGIGAFLIVLVDPWMVLWFLVMFVVIQQIEGNLIYPHVVGKQIGIPSI
ncbi:MAG TPA: AI-2E family transporter [Erysipelothrix sp.]|nr:AI-2E family transporter [Erysipelothrix sp.]